MSDTRSDFAGVTRPRFPRLLVALFLVLAGCLVIGGMALWWPRRGETSTACSDLGLALVGGGLALAAGGLISYAVFIAERRFDAALRASDDARERTSLQLALATAPSLRGIDLSGRDLSRFVLRAKDMHRANLSGSTLWGADLSATNLTNAHVSQGNLEAADLSEANLSEANLEEADLSAAILNSTRLTRAILHGARLVQAHLVESDLREASLAGANLNGACLRGANLTGAKLTDASLAEADLSFAVLCEANLARADFAGTRPPAPSHFERPAKVSGATLTGARYTEDTRWPDGFDPQAAGAVLIG